MLGDCEVRRRRDRGRPYNTVWRFFLVFTLMVASEAPVCSIPLFVPQSTEETCKMMSNISCYRPIPFLVSQRINCRVGNSHEVEL